MKPFLCFSLFSLLLLSAHAQSFTGYSSGNYTGVNGVFFNPAYAANSRFRWDFNLVQINASVSNDVASYKLSTITQSLDNKEITNKLYGSRNANAQANVDILGPSLLFNINSKTAFAFTTRYRVLGNLRNIDGSLLQAIKGEDAPAAYNITNNNMQVAVSGWMEAGVTWANVLVDKNKHYLKGGISVKYLGGIANAAVSTHNLNSAVNLDGSKENYYAANASGDVNLQFAGASTGNFSGKDLFKFDGSGAGIDLGVSYEFRPDKEHYKSADGSYDRSANVYKLRASLALLDAGSIKFTKDPQRSGAYTVGITGSNQFNLDALNTEIDSLSNTFAANPALFTLKEGSSNTYKVSLPTALMAELDYHFAKGFYINLATHLSLAKDNDVYKMRSLNNVVVTPRLETPAFGVYLPMQINNLSGFNAGACLRLGPLVIGSSNLLTALGGSKMVDIYFGMRLMCSKYK